MGWQNKLCIGLKLITCWNRVPYGWLVGGEKYLLRTRFILGRVCVAPMGKKSYPYPSPSGQVLPEKKSYILVKTKLSTSLFEQRLVQQSRPSVHIAKVLQASKPYITSYPKLCDVSHTLVYSVGHSWVMHCRPCPWLYKRAQSPNLAKAISLNSMGIKLH
jgi:hypothetical protein